MRLIIRIIKRDATDEEAIAIKQAVKKVLEKYPNVEIDMQTTG